LRKSDACRAACKRGGNFAHRECARAGLVSAWNSYAAATGVLYAGHIIEIGIASMRRAALGLAAVAYSAPALTPGQTVITGAQIEELRGGVK